MNVEPKTLRILVVDDSALYRQLVRNVLRDVPGVECVGAARSGREALATIDEQQPDLLTLDVQMPDLNGIAVLKELRKRRSKAKAIMLSSLTAVGAQTTTDALLEGAFDFILKPAGRDAAVNRQQLLAELTDKIAAFREHGRTSSGRFPTPVKESIPAVGEPAREKESATIPRDGYELVLIGTSTGGPPALRELLPQLPGDFPAPILIVQHMPAQFTHSLAARLNETSPLEVVEACDGMTLEAGFAYLAPGGRHMKLAKKRDKRVIALADDPPEHGCRPAVDVLFRSAASILQGPPQGLAIAVVLTGMGRDGVAGCRELKSRGARIVVQHPEGCVVYGMPKAVADERLHDAQLRLDRIAPALVAAMRGAT